MSNKLENDSLQTSLFFRICLLALLAVVVFGCTKQIKDNKSNGTIGYKLEMKDCQNHNECKSGVCDHYKQDYGKCAAFSCATGEKSDNNNFFCNKEGIWERSKKKGEKCTDNFECYQPTCFMIPSCDMTDIPRTKAFCKNNICVHEAGQDKCEAQGLKRILKKEDCNSMAQRILFTVCAPCGNGICDKELESKCNCPEDCK